jgi:hypothetical protein
LLRQGGEPEAVLLGIDGTEGAGTGDIDGKAEDLKISE